MELFITIELPLIIIGFFIIAVSVFVGTRKFINNGQGWKKIVPYTTTFILIFILGHFYMTKNRIEDVKNRFLHGGAIICENKANRKMAQSIIIDPNLKQNWKIENYYFTSPNFTRKFHLSRCIPYYYPRKDK